MASPVTYATLLKNSKITGVHFTAVNTPKFYRVDILAGETRGSITNGAKIYVKEFKLDLTV